MAWFEEFLTSLGRLGGRPGGLLKLLALNGAGTIFENRGGAFQVLDKQGYSDSDHSYTFLEDSPALLAPVVRQGFARLVGARPGRPGCEVWAVADRLQSPEYLLLAELPAGVLADSGLAASGHDPAAAVGFALRQALVQDIGLRRSPAGGAEGFVRPEAAPVDLPVWLADLLPDLVNRESPFLILAEPGSGKEELVMALLHQKFGSIHSGVFFHPGRLSQAVQLRELFGDPAGARLGGESPALPIVSRDEPAIVIQEAGDLDPHVQLRILALFSSGEHDRFWIFESSRDLERMVQAEKFLRGLYQMMKPGQVVLPPVRARRDRIEEEVERLLTSFRLRYQRDVHLDGDALDAMLRHDWRGNWRELKNTLESAFLMSAGTVIQAADLRLGLWTVPEDWDDLNLRKKSAEVEKNLLLRAYSLHAGNQVQMARALGISRGSLQYKLEKYGLN
ncbi:MAG: sigma 54-interacting transcriptional regulator [bacterium]|nr:sigma 54-interacting transcriptional regulator [bacterium]